MKKRIIALLLCCVMLLTLSPSLIATATADDETVQQVEQTGETKNTDPQPDQQPDQSKDGDKNEPQPTEEPKQDTAPVEEDGADADEPAPAPAVVPVVEQNVPVTSEIVSPTVNFTDVAPFLDPVSGSSMRRALRNVATQDAKDDGISMSKTATANKDGSYTITLETYATGSKVISEITKDIPTDIILVLDQSGSMADAMGSVSFTEYKDSGRKYHTRNQDYYEYRHNGGSSNLWHKLADGTYVSVSVTKQEQWSYTQLGNLVNYDTSWGSLTTDCYYYYANRLYEKVGDGYKKVTVTENRDGDRWNGYTYSYTYTFADGTTITSSDRSTTPNLGSHAPLYTGSIDNAKTVYTYTYTDAAGNAQTIGTWTGDTTRPTPALYRRSVSTSGGGSRLKAIKDAASAFVDAVAQKAAGKDGNINTTDDNINHRIAVVGFASQSGYGNNTELLSISGTNSGSVGVAYDNITAQNLKDVVQDMNTVAGKTMVDNAINALAANGATRIDLGMDMAERILNANPVPAGGNRNRVVIVFTDGSPTNQSGFQKNVANNAINTAGDIKEAGTTVYSIGVFSGADASSAGTEPSGNLGQYDDLTAASNWFMQKVSSNNGTPRTPSYYLSASDADSLNSIFKQISDQISTGGSDSQLTESAVVRDIISPQFTLPAGASAENITLETYACIGVDANGAYTWSKNADAMGATATVSGDQVDVTGFNYSENWCGSVTEKGSTTYRGNKLVIKFTVQPKDGFLGGNDVITNGEKSGIYVNDQASNPLKPFEQPTVNVPIKDVTVTAANENVYLLGGVTADQLKRDATVEVGGVTLDLSAENYGLEAWQNKYVDITVTVKDAAGNAIPTTGLTDDQKYTIEVKVAPKTTTPTSTEGTQATEQSGSGEGSINVFKPELTFKDSTAYYGDNAPAYSGNLTFTKWKHGSTYSTEQDVTMIGDAPTLDITYTPEANKVVNGKINTKEDIAVDVTVKIGSVDVTDKTTFVHQACDPACSWNVTAPNGNPAFLIHVKTCQLTITKKNGNDGEPYVFTVKKDGQPYTEVTIVGNNNVTIYELPVGTYTIEENTKWSWRYTANNGSSAALTSQNPTGTIICTNTRTIDKWLNGFSDVVTNTFGVKHD